MNDQQPKLNAYLRKNLIQYPSGDSLLEQLYWDYIERNSIDSTQLRDQFEQVYKSLPALSEEKFDEVFAQINKLMLLDEALAFRAGIKIGLRLTLELLE